MTSRFLLSVFMLGGFLTGVAAAQPFGAGLKFGVPLNDAFTVKSPNPFDYIADTHRYVIGPFVEVRLPGGFAVELDALYRSFDFSSVQHSVSVGVWEFPLLAKYKFFKGPVKPF